MKGMIASAKSPSSLPTTFCFTRIVVSPKPSTVVVLPLVRSVVRSRTYGVSRN